MTVLRETHSHHTLRLSTTSTLNPLSVTAPRQVSSHERWDSAHKQLEFSDRSILRKGEKLRVNNKRCVVEPYL